MSLQAEIMVTLKEAMKSKDQVALTSLRAVKAELLLAQTSSGSKEEISEEWCLLKLCKIELVKRKAFL